LNTARHSFTILFIAVSINNIVDISGNKQFVKTRACLSFIKRNCCTARYHKCRVVSVFATSLRHTQYNHRRSEGRKISALLAQNFQRRPPVFMHVFGRAHGALQLCFVQLKTVAQSARYSTFKYPVTLKHGLGVTKGHRKLYHCHLPYWV